jgi:hypothetical protein
MNEQQLANAAVQLAKYKAMSNAELAAKVDDLYISMCQYDDVPSANLFSLAEAELKSRVA